MNAQLPAYLQGLGSPGLAARAAEGIGSARPPHLRTGNNAFVLVDAAGNEQPSQTTYLDVCIADICDVMCKQYYGDENGPKKWTADSNDPPACWSANGIAPSVEAISPQSARCESCEWNKRGSALAADNKTPTKACRDEKWLCIIVPGVSFPIQLKITPGSFVNWRAYTEMFRGKPIDMIHVFTRLTFEQGSNGVLNFALSPTGYIDEPTAGMIGKMREAKASDILVGRTDRPRQAQLMAPQGMTAPQGGAPGHVVDQAQQTQPQGFQPAPFASGPAAPAQNAAAFGQQTQTPAPTAETKSPSEAPRRRRRTADQIAADNAAAANQGVQAPAAGNPAAPFAQYENQSGPAFGAAPGTGGAPAPFGAAPTNNGAAGAFGIQNNAPPPPDGLGDALDSLFEGPK